MKLLGSAVVNGIHRVMRSEFLRQHISAELPPYTDHPVFTCTLQRGIPKLHDTYAPGLAQGAFIKAVSAAGVSPKKVGLLIVSTSTGFMAPGITARIVESMGLRPDITLLDLCGMGCSSIPSAWTTAKMFLNNGVDYAACVHVDVNTAVKGRTPLEDIIPFSVYGDGAGAVIWGREGTGPECDGIFTSCFPNYEASTKMFYEGQHLWLSTPRIHDVSNSLKPIPQTDRIICASGNHNVIASFQKTFGKPSVEAAERCLQFGNSGGAFSILVLNDCLERGFARFNLAGFGIDRNAFSITFKT